MGLLKIKHGRTVVFIDKSNLHYALREAGWEIDYNRFFSFLRNELKEGYEAYHYEGYFPDKTPGLPPLKNEEGEEIAETRKQRKFQFFNKLREIGFKIETKPIGSVYDSTKGEYQHKCNFDVEITITALDRISQFNTYIFFSGDGDFTKLIKYIKGKFKQTIVVCTSKRTSHSLQKAANQFINLNTLKDQIGRK
jgi:uncharacterized LabA/DUF88 family protein